ncbi:disulfide bond formation protein B [Marinomonas sp. MED121]|uniref:disulfide bond formation protein B n=1 Tax=Marinomonas sp. MED121 TaxID=314277 RepID=UPI00006900BF|nr:disulfide bond formation protein B [Marinomonas sp. MED121]EAQ65711.1 disulfide bond formation protein B [Marinomonas sp. MED121]
MPSKENQSLFNESSQGLPNWLTVINFHALIAFTSFALLGVAFYMEYQMGLEPCPLCMLQRIMFFMLGVIALISFFHKSNPALKYYALGITTFAVLGAALSIRHLYLQNLPEEQLPACLPGLSYMVEVFPWQEILSAMVMGTGECGDVLWTFLGLSIPGWTLVAFAGIAILNFVIFCRVRHL